jgi:hypothetical protein
VNFLNYINGENNKEFLKILEKYNLEPNLFFYYNFREVKDTIFNQYTLSFPKELDGESFLNNYIIFAKELTIDEFYNNLRLNINQKIKKKFDALNIAKELKIDYPDIHPFIHLSDKEEFQKGQKILTIEIEQLKLMEKSLSRQSLDWDPFHVKAIKPKQYKYDIKKYLLGILLTLGLGFLLSLLIIFFKDDYKKIKFF